MVSSTAIRAYSKGVYEECINMINADPKGLWAWVRERAWQVLWEQPARDSNEVVEALRLGIYTVRNSKGKHKASLVQARHHFGTESSMHCGALSEDY